MFEAVNVNFNSKKVRLIHAVTIDGKTYPAFQFQKGTINPANHLQSEYLITEFQFQKGTINPYTEKKYLCMQPQFQFQKGTINPVSRQQGFGKTIPFQFPKGTINPRTDIQIRGA